MGKPTGPWRRSSTALVAAGEDTVTDTIEELEEDDLEAQLDSGKPELAEGLCSLRSP